VARTLSTSRLLSSTLGRWLLVAGLALGLSQPRDFVWCQTESGHAALEALDAGCCGDPAGEAACATDPGTSSSFGSSDPAGERPRACTDVLVEAAARLSLVETVSPRGTTTALLLEDGEPSSPGPRHFTGDRAVGARAAQSGHVGSTVLRI
jgi:hypothetical protein